MISRREFLECAALTAGALSARAEKGSTAGPLQEFRYRDVELVPGLAQTQFAETLAVLLSLDENSLLKPWRLRAGLPAPGPALGGWYDGFAPAHSFGQWLSALARGYDATRDPAARAKLQRLLALYEQVISPRFYTNFRFPAYVYDKMVLALIDAHQFADIPSAFELLERTTDAAEPHLPPHALDRDEPQRAWRRSIGENTTDDYTWDESYTMPENLYLAWERGAGDRYRVLARRFLLDTTYFDPLSENQNVLANHHAYSFCNALSSAMQAYLADGSEKHLLAAKNAFEMIRTTQSFATGGWGPDESFVVAGSSGLYTSLTKTHHNFETPCGSYAHFKLTRYLLRVTRDGRYGDSMERVFYNTVLGAKPLQRDGSAFYYSDYHLPGSKTYFPDQWPCCSGTLPQIAADYRISAYLRDGDDIFVNLYLPSTLQWMNDVGAQLAITQSGDYPFGGSVTMRVRTSRASQFGLKLRVPRWVPEDAATIRVNGALLPVRIQRGFATIGREWADGDRVDLEIPLTMRLEPIDSDHPDTAALVRGPLVLFAMAENLPKVTRQQLLASTRVSDQQAWRAETDSGPLFLRPFTAIEDERYWTYLSVA